MAEAVRLLMKAPTLTVREAMLAAKFKPLDANNKTIQRKVAWSLPGKTKHGMKENIPLCNINVNSGNISEVSPLTDTMAADILADMSATNKENLSPSPPQKLKKQRMNSQQAQDKREADLMKKMQYSKAHKAATILYDNERGKEKGLTLRKIESLIREKHKVGPSASTIYHYVVELGLVGMPPRNRGPEGNIPSEMYAALCAAFGSFMRINQINALVGDNTRRKVIPVIAEVTTLSVTQCTELLRRLCRDTAIDMKAEKMYFAEERRVKWTTFSNLELWFNSWEKTLRELGFLDTDDCGRRCIPTELLRNILNFDETCLSLDGSSINRGGRPAAYYQDPRLPQVGISTSKSSQTTTMITGSNAWGEALPPHFQFISSAQTDEGQQIRNECVRYMQQTIGTFGLGEEKSLPVSLGMNEKGGMDEEEFAKYIRNAIMPLYPNAAPVKGKWVILKCDSGPGRLNLDLLADLRTSGFILFPGVPNTTAVTQETDQNYGPFKTQYCKNLDVVIDERIKQKKSTSLPTWQVGLIVFGGVDPETNVIVKSAFDQGFSREGCKHAWEKVGAAPLTRACLNNKKVQKSLGDGSVDYQQLLLNVQDANDVATHALTAGGMNGNALKRTIIEIPTTQQITEEHSQERYEILAKANTHGKLFSATGGTHLTSDDVFIGAELSTREKEQKRLTVEKNRRLRMLKVEEKGKMVLDTKGSDCTSWNKTELDAVLAWYNPPRRTKMTPEEKIQAWITIQTKGMAPPTCERWSDDDERALLEASKTEITVGDTALGRAQARKKNELKQSALSMTDDEWAEVVSARQSMLDSSLDTTTDDELDLSLETTVNGAEDEV